MLNTTALDIDIDIDQARYDAAAQTQRFLRQHGASLCNLLDALDDPGSFSAFCDLHATFGQAFPDPDAMADALRSIHRALEDLAPSALDRICHARNLPASDMARWYGARVTELLARFRHAA